MGSERVVGVRAGGDPSEVSGIVPQSLVELFRLLKERMEAGSGEEDGTEAWAVRVGYLQVCLVFEAYRTATPIGQIRSLLMAYTQAREHGCVV